MRLAELSEKSGVSTATIKYYLREGLLAPGERVAATTSEYDGSHLRRLRLIRALIQVGKVPVANVRAILTHIDDPALGRTMRLGAAMWELPHPPEPPPADTEDELTTGARTTAEGLLASLGWTTALDLSSLSPSFRALVTALATLRRLGYDWDVELLTPYAQLMHQVAQHDLNILESHPSETEQAETAVAATILVEPILRALHHLAQEEESARRYGL